MKLPSLEKIRVVGSCQKVPKFDFQSQFSMSKIIQIFSFFALKNTNLGAHFLLFIEIFWQHQFLILYTSLENFTTGIAIIRVEVFNSCFWGEKDNFKGFFLNIRSNHIPLSIQWLQRMIALFICYRKINCPMRRFLHRVYSTSINNIRTSRDFVSYI